MPVAIITGSDSGIGKATAVLLAKHGFDIGVTWNSDEEGANGTADEVRRAGRKAEVRHLDVSRFQEAVGIVDELAEALGGLDVFVNNAGTGISSPFLEFSLSDWQRVIDVDLTGPFVLGQSAARRMVRAGTGGRIINVTSVHEHVPLKESSAYSAAKGGLGLLTKVMALELAEHGITVNSVAPGEISTPMTGQHDVDPETQDRPRIPLGRPGHSDEIAGIIAYLAGDHGTYATGSSFIVDGGLLLIAAVQDT